MLLSRFLAPRRLPGLPEAPGPAARWLRCRRLGIALPGCQDRPRDVAQSSTGRLSEPGSAAGRGRGRSGGGGRAPTAGQGRGRGPTGGRWQNGRGGGDPDNLNSYPDLPSLAEAVKQRAGVWRAAGNIRTLQAAFTFAFKLGMRPGKPPRDDDPERADLLRNVMRTLAAAYLPLVPDLREPADCVLPLWACAKAGYWEGGLAEALAARLAQRGGELLQRAARQGHSLLWWSLSEAPFEARQCLPVAELLRVSQERLLRMGPSELDPRSCSNVLLAAARLRQGSEALLHHMAACLCESLPKANGQDLANSLYSLGKLAEECGHTPRQQDLQRLTGEVAARLAAGQQDTAAASSRAFTPQALSNMLWACSKLGYTDSALLQPLAAAAGMTAEQSNAQALANSLYALAVLGCSGKEYTALQLLMPAALGLLRRRPSEFLAQELSNSLWALAVLQPPESEALRDAAAAECQRRCFKGFEAQELSNAAWALAKLGYRSEQGWYAAAVEAAMRPAVKDAANSQDWSNLLYALALVRHRPPAALLAGMAESQQLRSQASPQDCANSLWALANLYGSGLDRGEDAAAVLRLVDVLVERLGQLLRQPAGEMPTAVQHMTNSLWSLAVMGPAVLSRHSSLVEGLLREAARRWEAGRHGGVFTVENTFQLWQVQLELAHADSGSSEPLTSTCNAVRSAAESALKRTNRPTSQLQRQVLSALTRLQERQQQPTGSGPVIRCVEPGCWVPELCRWADAVVALEGGRRVAVEVDGPTRFLANQPYTRIKEGPTQLRDRQLERVFGPTNVVCVPYWEWGVLQDQAAQEEYLCRLLEA